MLALCLLAILTGFAISYNINNYEPLIGKRDPLYGWTPSPSGRWSPPDRERRLLRPAADDACVLPLGDLYSPGLVTASAVGGEHPGGQRYDRGDVGEQHIGLGMAVVAVLGIPT